MNPQLDSFRHKRGAMVLLDLRKRQAEKNGILVEDRMNLCLDKQVRREIVSAFVRISGESLVVMVPC